MLYRRCLSWVGTKLQTNGRIRSAKYQLRDRGPLLDETFVRYSSGLSQRGSNVILMGSPGAGKTTVGHLVACQLGMPHLDVDNDHLERVWGMPVSQKLADLGSEGFLEAEGQALLQLDACNTLVSLSGSNPMHAQAMAYMQSQGIVVYLDVEDYDILQRLERMKVNRIVGQHEGTTMSEILKFRKQFYEGSYDIRILCERDESQESIASKVITAVRSLQQLPGGYISTRQSGSHVGQSFLDVLLQGLASDGGLYVPQQQIPHMTQGEWARLVHCTYQERALCILERWIAPCDLHPSTLGHMINTAYYQNFQHPDIAPMTQLNQYCYILELFHGPTASFKDLALQLTPQFFSAAINGLAKTEKPPTYLILVATSGDTGSAVLDGFKIRDGIKVLVLYPNEGVSEIQKRQMVSASAPNLKVIGVQSDFDFCQTAIKSIFNDAQFGDELIDMFNVKLSAANSINWGRLVPQVVYHASGYLDLVKKGVISFGEPVDVCIPTGNFGNILAAYYAKEMGIPFDKLICASNENNILTQFFHTGHFDMRSRRLHRTASPSIDILKSSKLERFIYHVTGGRGDLVTSLFTSLDREGVFQVTDKLREKLSSIVWSDWASEHQCMQTIKRVHTQYNYLLDPHTAVAMDVAKRFMDPNKTMIVAATAHCSKFAQDVLGGLGRSCTSPHPMKAFESIRRLDARPTMQRNLETAMNEPIAHKTVCKASTKSITEHIKDFVKND